MFSGIVETTGIVSELFDSSGGCRIAINCHTLANAVAVGDSVSVNGACLTVIESSENSFVVEAMLETLKCTTLKHLTAGSIVNLERALKLSDRLGGHLVSGHIDAVGEVVMIQPDGFAKLVTFTVDKALAPFFVEKGSVTIDGVSLTIVDCDGLNGDPESNADLHFRVALIPHTLKATTLGQLKMGSKANVETDIIARYVARWLTPLVTRQPAQLPVNEVICAAK